MARSRTVLAPVARALQDPPHRLQESADRKGGLGLHGGLLQQLQLRGSTTGAGACMYFFGSGLAKSLAR